MQKIIRIPAYLEAQIRAVALHLDQGGEVQLVPMPDLFTPAPKKTGQRKGAGRSTAARAAKGQAVETPRREGPKRARG